MIDQAYHVEDGILRKYVTDNKQRFDAIVVPVHYTLALLRLAHDELGHNCSARTYMLLRRLYYWKGMKPHIYKYVKQCRSCQQRNRQIVKYVQGQFKVPTTPMEFISMDLIGEFHPPSSKGHKYAFTVICMLTGYTFCIPLKTKTAAGVVKAYVDNVYVVPKLGICPILRLGKPNLESAMLPNLKIGQLHNLKIGLPKLGILND